MYVMGAEENGAPGQYWTTLPAVPDHTPTPFYLAPGGVLADTAPAAGSPPAAFTYDPANPVPSHGGDNLLIGCGPQDQRPVEGRPDVLIFTTPPLTSAVALSGPLVAELFVGTNVTDTDVVIKLIDVYPTDSKVGKYAGTSTLVADGIARLRWRDFPATAIPQLLSGDPSVVVPVTVGAWNTTYIFAPGHQMRVHVTSSNYPRFLPNPNNGLPVAVQGTGPNVTAHTTVQLGGAYPSRIILPVVDAATQLPPYPVEAVIKQALEPLKGAWREALGRMGAEDLDEPFEEWVARRVGAVAEHARIRR